jgi:hypothetical protein
MGEMSNMYEIWLENLKGRDHLDDLGIDRRRISEWFLQKQDSPGSG